MADRLVERAAAWLALVPILFFLLFRIVRRPEFFRNVGEAAPESLAAIRILVCTILLGHLVAEDPPSSASLPWALIAPMVVLEVLCTLPVDFRRFCASPEAVPAFQDVASVPFLAPATC